MKASDVTFTEAFMYADTHPECQIARSFIQVELGLNNLRGAWDGFTDASDFNNNEYNDANHVFESFYHSLYDYIDILQSMAGQVGSEVL